MRANLVTSGSWCCGSVSGSGIVGNVASLYRPPMLGGDVAALPLNDRARTAAIAGPVQRDPRDGTSFPSWEAVEAYALERGILEIYRSKS